MDVFDVEYVSLKRFKREIVSLLIIEAKIDFAYVAVERYGNVEVYDENFTFRFGYNLQLDRDSANSVLKSRLRRISPHWVTDAVHDAKLKTLVYSTSSRCLHFYLTAPEVHVETFTVAYLPEIPTRLAFSRCQEIERDPDVSSEKEFTCRLFIGQENGDIMFFTFKKATKSLFKSKIESKDKPKYRLQWRELFQPEQYEFVKVTKLKRSAHDISPVMQMTFYYAHNILVASSRSRARSITKYHFGIRGLKYVFPSSWGVTCFDFRKDLDMVASGNTNCIVHLWNSVVTKRPMATLSGHCAPLVDVAFCENIPVLLSLDANAVLKLWSVDAETCIETVQLDFASHLPLGMTLKFANPALVWDVIHPGKVLVTCCNCIAVVTGYFGPPPPLQSWTPSPKRPLNPFPSLDLDTAASTFLSHSFTLEKSHLSEKVMAQENSQLEHVLTSKFFRLPHKKDSLFPCPKSNAPLIQKKVARRMPAMREAAMDGTPYTALPLMPMETITIPHNLPVSSRMKRDGYHMRSVHEVLSVPFPLDPLDWFDKC